MTAIDLVEVDWSVVAFGYVTYACLLIGLCIGVWRSEPRGMDTKGVLKDECERANTDRDDE